MAATVIYYCLGGKNVIKIGYLPINIIVHVLASLPQNEKLKCGFILQ